MIERQHITGFLSEMKFVAVVLVVAAIFRTTAFGMYHIPSESMLPTIAVGDRIAVSKFAYGYSRHSVPFSAAPSVPTNDRRLFGKLPARGHIIVFKHPRTGENYIKRVIGLPGDKVELRSGRLYINDTLIDRNAKEDRQYREHEGSIVTVRLFDEYLAENDTHKIYERSDVSYGDTMAPIHVPENHLFVLGDNRDNSIDSRYLKQGVGFLPVENVVGKAIGLTFSTNHCRPEPGLICLNRNWFSPL